MTGPQGRLLPPPGCPERSESAALPRRVANMGQEAILRLKPARTDGCAPQAEQTPPYALSDMRPPVETPGSFPRPPGLRGRTAGSLLYFTCTEAVSTAEKLFSAHILFPYIYLLWLARINNCFLETRSAAAGEKWRRRAQSLRATASW